MNMREFERQLAQRKTLESLGFTRDEAAQLRRISMALQRWHELECGTDTGCIERDEKTNKPYFVRQVAGGHTSAGREYAVYRHRVADRETGALKRLAAIIKARNERPQLPANETQGAGRYDGNLSTYIQGDPRGAALYIIRPGDVPEGEEVGAYYSRGICVY